MLWNMVLGNVTHILKINVWKDLYVIEIFFIFFLKQIKLLNKCQLSGRIQILKWESIQV